MRRHSDPRSSNPVDSVAAHDQEDRIRAERRGYLRENLLHQLGVAVGECPHEELQRGRRQTSGVSASTLDKDGRAAVAEEPRTSCLRKRKLTTLRLEMLIAASFLTRSRFASHTSSPEGSAWRPRHLYARVTETPSG